MINIAFFNSSKAWGGGEKWHLESAVHFSKRSDYQVHVFGAPNSELQKRLAAYPNIPYVDFAVSNRSFLNPIKIQRLRTLFTKRRIDILIINGSADMKLAAHAAHLAGIKRIIYRRGLAVDLRNNAVNRYILKHYVTEIIANSMETKHCINRNNAKMFPEEKIKVIYNPIDTRQFCAKNQAPRPARKELVIGNLGRLVPQKNQAFLIDLSRELSQRSIPHKIHIGGIGALEEELQAYSQQCQTQNNVHFLGFVDNLSAFFAEIDVFLLSSKWEGFGYVLAEAALFHKPTIAFDVSSNAEIIADKQSGYLIPVDDVSACIAALENLQDPQTRENFGQAGYRLVCERFDSQVIYQQLETYLS